MKTKFSLTYMNIFTRGRGCWVEALTPRNDQQTQNGQQAQVPRFLDAEIPQSCMFECESHKLHCPKRRWIQKEQPSSGAKVNGSKNRKVARIMVQSNLRCQSQELILVQSITNQSFILTGVYCTADSKKY